MFTGILSYISGALIFTIDERDLFLSFFNFSLDFPRRLDEDCLLFFLRGREGAFKGSYDSVCWDEYTFIIR